LIHQKKISHNFDYTIFFILHHNTAYIVSINQKRFLI